MNKLIFVLLTSLCCACTNVVMNHSQGSVEDVSDTSQPNESNIDPTINFKQ